MFRSRRTIAILQFHRHSFAVVSIALAAVLNATQFASATVTTAGNTTAGAPAGGGALAGAFNVGNTGFGSLTITGTPGTPLTTSGIVTIGVTATGIGNVTLNGLDSNWTANGAFHIGDAGSATVTVTNLAKLTTTLNTTLADNVDSHGQVTVTGAGSIWDSIADNLIIGAEGTGIIEILNGGRVLSAVNEIGDQVAGTGRVLVSGNQSLWRTTGNMFIGQEGRGLLQIFDGARVENSLSQIGTAATAIGDVEVAGFGTLWDSNLAMEVGVAGAGSLKISDRARVMNTDGVIGKLATSPATAEVRGAGTLWHNAATLTVGALGRGSLTIAEGARVNSTTSKISDDANSYGEALVDGIGSLWFVTGVLTVSEPGEAYLTVSNGGRIFATGGINVGAAGRVTLDGGRLEGPQPVANAGLIQGSGTIDAALNNSTGNSEIRIASGQKLLTTGALTTTGLVDVVDGELEVQGATTNAGMIAARNSTLRLRGGLTNNGSVGISFGTTDVFGDITNAAARTINVSGGADVTFYDDFAQNGVFQVAKVGDTVSKAVIFGAFSGSGFTGGGDVFALGDLRPGHSPAQVTMGGNLFLGGSTSTFIELGGTALGQFDQLLVSGNLTLGGTLTPSLINGFSLGADQQFVIASVTGTRTGEFTGLGQGALVGNLGGRDLFITYTGGDGNDVALFTAAAAALQGDFNNDGIVNAADYTVWRNNLGDATEDDINYAGNGTAGVDSGDYTVWKQNYGNTNPGAGAGGFQSPVPEPTTFTLLALALICGAPRQRSRTPLAV